VEVVILAAEQAARDYSLRVQQLIDAHRSEQLGSAEAQARQLLHAALARNDEYAAQLRNRKRELTHTRERLVAELRERVDSAPREVDRVVQTRAELYRLIGALGSVQEAGARSTNGSGDGHAAAEPQPGNQPSR
jgi:hypothetical protein